MTAVTHACTVDYVAKMLGEDAELLEAITCNDDNKTWHEFLDDFVDTGEIVARIKAKSPR